MTKDIIFRKTGAEIKESVRRRCQQLQQRLNRRNTALAEFLQNPELVRSYIVRTAGGGVNVRYHQSEPILGPLDIPGEQIQEIHKIAQRIYELEQEIRRLRLILAHLDEEEDFKLQFEQLVSYGFEPDPETDSQPMSSSASPDSAG